MSDRSFLWMWVLLVGCSNPSAPTSVVPDTPVVGEASWEDVRPILQAKCARCHSADRLSTYRPLETHAEVAALRQSILQKISDSPIRGLRMPVAANHVSDTGCTPPGAQQNDKRLTDAEVQTMVSFLDRDDHADHTDTSEPIGTVQTVPLADSETYVSSEYPVVNDGFVTPPDGAPPGYMEELGYDERDYDQMEDDFLCIAFDPERTEASWLTGVQVETEAGQIFLNSQLLIDTHGGFDTAWANAEVRGEDWYHCDGGVGFSDALPLWRTVPGSEAIELPSETGLRFQPGWRFVLRVDFHTHFDRDEFERLDQNGVIDGQAGTMTWFDRATLRARWGEESAITRELQWLTIGPGTPAERDSFAIPRGESEHRFTASPAVPGDYKVFSAEMGMGKTGVRASIVEGASNTCIASNTDYSPKWIEQATYTEADAPSLDPSSALELSCTYRSNVESPLTWGVEGEATLWGRRERCAGVVFYYPQ